MSKGHLALIAASVAIIAACAEPSMQTLSAGDETWILTGGKVNGQPLHVDTDAVTLSFAGGEAMVGNGAVNNYRAPVEIIDGRIRHNGPLITTRMAGSIAAMKLESAYLGALSKANALKRSGDTLIISGDGDELLFVLKQAIAK